MSTSSLKIERARERRPLIEAINSPKHKLLAILNQLESMPGNRGACDKLATIIGRLEDWQRKNA